MRGGVQAHICHAIQPKLPLVTEVGIMPEGAATDEITAEVTDWSLDLAFGSTGGTRRAPAYRIARYAKRRNATLRAWSGLGSNLQPRLTDRATATEFQMPVWAPVPTWSLRASA